MPFFTLGDPLEIAPDQSDRYQHAERDDKAQQMIGHVGVSPAREHIAEGQEPSGRLDGHGQGEQDPGSHAPRGTDQADAQSRCH